ncbi:MAG TPA: SbcC/MukB-like Walker B domain-containing protein [Blastocatellia bacterium]|nr:SbcC/MukB-like Walker B domain-containing protein [Blastocatellia bacterium]
MTIAASFLQLYRVGEGLTSNRRTARTNLSGRPTIRLVAFDEAFSKMDQQHIGSTLDLFQKFNLQVIMATPLERCEYLVPKICTSLVLCVELSDHLLKTDRKLEQEAVEASLCVKTLQLNTNYLDIT